MHSVLSIIYAVAFTLAPLIAHADEMLTKSFVSNIFSTSFADWSSSLKESVEMGDAKIAVNGTYIWTQLTLTPFGILKVTPEYLPGQLRRPGKLQISIEENKVKSDQTLQLTDKQLLSVISSYQRTMLPEYSVTTTIDLIGGVSQYHFTVYEVGEYPQLDRVAQQTNGCWQQCIRR